MMSARYIMMPGMSSECGVYDDNYVANNVGFITHADDTSDNQVVALEEIKGHFPSGTTFEDYWPAKGSIEPVASRHGVRRINTNVSMLMIFMPAFAGQRGKLDTEARRPAQDANPFSGGRINVY